MRHLALSLLIIFTCNLVSELGVGHCDETGIDNHQVFQTLQNTLDQDQSSQNSTEPCAHLCHFGHCGHLIFNSAPTIAFKAPEFTYGDSTPDHAQWRILAPLFKPPKA